MRLHVFLFSVSSTLASNNESKDEKKGRTQLKEMQTDRDRETETETERDTEPKQEVKHVSFSSRSACAPADSSFVCGVIASTLQASASD